MPRDKYDDHINNVLPMNDWLKTRQRDNDGITQLLAHMRLVRDEVPVNRRLQEELRKKLIARQNELKNQNNPVTVISDQPNSTAEKRKINYKYLALAGFVMIVTLIYFLWQNYHINLILETVGQPQEVTKFWTEAQPLQPDVSPDGSKLLLVRGGSLVLLTDNGAPIASFNPPEGESFSSPRWAPTGEKVAYIEQGPQGDELKELYVKDILSQTKALSQVSAAPQEQEKVPKETTHLSCLSYSPDGKKLAYVSTAPGGQAVIWIKPLKGEPYKLGAGDYPTWSPDNQHLVVQKPDRDHGYNLWLVNISSGRLELLGPGDRAIWNRDGYLAFVYGKDKEKILTFLPTGEPQYSVQQQVEEIRVAFLGKDGSPAVERLGSGEGWLTSSHLLMSPESHISVNELNWLRQQEISGSKEPKTLVLNEIDKCEGLAFSPDGKWLFFARRDGGTVSLEKVCLEERPEKRRD